MHVHASSRPAVLDVDPQKARLYEWEDRFSSFGKRSESRLDIQKLVYRACRRYDIEPPIVRFVSKAKSPGLTVTTFYDTADHSIQFGYRSCNAAIACHEVAHAVIAEYQENVEDHGPEFLGVYFDLLEWAKVLPRSAIHASAREMGLSWKPARRAQKKGG